eukprot:3368292-Lingulodinium_polyedra.AAC.1
MQYCFVASSTKHCPCQAYVEMRERHPSLSLSGTGRAELSGRAFFLGLAFLGCFKFSRGSE